MAAMTQKKTNAPIAAYVILGLLTALGLALGVYRLAIGLGSTTNLNDYFPWGLWIVLDVFMIPAAGAAFTVSAIGHFFHRHDYHKILRPAVLIGFLGYVSVVLILILDLGRWHQFYSILLPARINLHSFLEEVALSVTLYTMVLILELAPTILENRIIHLPRDRELDRPDGTGLDDLPHWMEVTSSVGIAAGAMLAYIIIARAFNLFPEEHAHEVSA